MKALLIVTTSGRAMSFEIYLQLAEEIQKLLPAKEPLVLKISELPDKIKDGATMYCSVISANPEKFLLFQKELGMMLEVDIPESNIKIMDSEPVHSE